MLRQIMEPVFWMGFFFGAGSAVVGLVIGIFLYFERIPRHVNELRGRGLYPQPGETVTESHYYGLLQAGLRIDAIRLYQQTHAVGLKEAKEAIERLASHLPLH